MNVANAFTPDWQQEYWGKKNYAKLLKIKNKYDPKRRMLCHRCVGWEEDDEEKCLKPFDRLSDRN